jgi:hypothetical protein
MHRRPSYITFVGYVLFVISVWVCVTTLWIYDPHPALYSPLASAPLNGWIIFLSIVGSGMAIASAAFILKGARWARWLYLLYFFYSPIIMHLSGSSTRSDLVFNGIKAMILFMIFLPSADEYFHARYKI